MLSMVEVSDGELHELKHNFIKIFLVLQSTFLKGFPRSLLSTDKIQQMHIVLNCPSRGLGVLWHSYFNSPHNVNFGKLLALPFRKFMITIHTDGSLIFVSLTFALVPNDATDRVALRAE